MITANRIAARILVAVALLSLLACAVIGATISWTLGAFLFGGFTLGPVLTTLVRHVGEHRAGRSLDVIGRDVQVPLPRAVAIATAYRKQKWRD